MGHMLLVEIIQHKPLVIQFGNYNSSVNLSYAFGTYNYGFKSGIQKGNDAMVLNLRLL